MNNIRRFSTLLLAMVMLFSISVPAYATDVDTGCSCSPEEGIHQQGCALYELSCSGKEGCAAATHNEGCPAAVVACSGLEACTAATHNEACLSQTPKAPACDKTENCPASEGHEEGCLKAAAETKAAEEAAKAAEEAAKAAAVKAVQDMIDTLPDVPVGYSPENPPAEIADKLQAITEAIAALPEDVASTIDQHVDMHRYYAFYAPGPAVVATIGKYEYVSLEAAIVAAPEKATITLLTDAPIEASGSDKFALYINKALTIEGVKKADGTFPVIKLNSNGKYDLRAINVDLDSINTDSEVIFRNLSIDASDSERGINIIDKAAKVTLENVSIKAKNYAVMVATSATHTDSTGITTGSTLSISHGEFTGMNVINIAAPRSTVTVEHAKFSTIDNNDAEDYSTIALYHAASGSTVSIDSCEFSYSPGLTDGAYVGDSSENSQIQITNCTPGITHKKYEARIGDASYSTLEDAISDACAGSTVTLINSVQLDAPLEVSECITLDMNNKTITGSISLDGAANITVTNPGEQDLGALLQNVVASSTPGVYLPAVAKVGSTAYISLEEAIAAAAPNATVTLLMGTTLDKSIVIEKNLTINFGNEVLSPAIGKYPVIRIQNNATVTIENGNISHDDFIFVLGSSDEETAGNLNIISGVYEGGTSTIFVTKGTLNISGGIFSVKPYEENGVETYQYLINCIDKNYSAPSPSAFVSITGGTFENFDPSENTAEGPATDFVPAGYCAAVNANGIYTVSKDVAVNAYAANNADKAPINSYASLEQAFRLAPSGSILKPAKDTSISTSAIVSASKNLTLDLNGKTISSASSADPAIRVTDAGSLTVTGEGIIDSSANCAYCITVGGPEADNNALYGTLNIKGGSFIGCVTAINVVRGTANLEGGSYEISNDHEHDLNSAYLINCYDANYNAASPVAHVNISGGIFKGFDPNDNEAETGGHTNFVVPSKGSVYENGSYVIGDAMASYNNNDYGSIASALKVAVATGGNAQPGIKLLCNNDLDSAISISSSTTIDADGNLHGRVSGFTGSIFTLSAPDIVLTILNPGLNAAAMRTLVPELCVKEVSESNIRKTASAARFEITLRHSGGTATCTAQANCEKCGQGYGQPAQHKAPQTESCLNTVKCTVCNQDMQNPNIKDHKYVYTASGSVITQQCIMGCGHKATASLELDKTISTKYSGIAIKPLTVSYSAASGNINAWAGAKDLKEKIAYTTNIYPGKATGKISIKGADNIDATAVMIFDINKMELKMWEHNDFYRDSGATLSFTIETNGKEPMKPVGPISLYSTAGKHLKDVRDYGVSYKNGDAVITLPAYALKGLDVGRYDLQVYLADSTDSSNTILAESVDQFRVRYPRIIPSTGDSANFLLWGGMLIGAAAAMGGALVLLKKSSKKSK